MLIHSNSVYVINFSDFYCLGVSELITAHPDIVNDITLENPSEPLCRKDWEKADKLRKWSRGHQFVVRGGGRFLAT